LLSIEPPPADAVLTSATQGSCGIRSPLQLAWQAVCSPVDLLRSRTNLWPIVRNVVTTVRLTSAWTQVKDSPSRLFQRLELSAALHRGLHRVLIKLQACMGSGSSLSALKKALSGGPSGAAGQYAGTTSRCCPRTLNPVWRQRLEMRLGGGELNEDGEYDNKDAPYTSLRIELWDRDLLSRDDFIGEVRIPLSPLMDARVHTYTLPLTDPEGKSAADSSIDSVTLTFSVSYES